MHFATPSPGRRRAAIALLTLPLFLLAPAPGRTAEATAVPETGTEIHLSETARHEIARDRLRAALQVQAEGGDPAKIQAEVNRRMDAALAAVKPVPAVKAETGTYTVYREGPPSDKPEADKWLASQTLILTSKDFTAALGAIGTLQSNGLIVAGLDFDVAPETLRAAEDSLTAEALAALRARADRIAAAMAMTVTRYKLLQVGNATEQGGPPIPVRMMAAKSSSASPPPVAEAGESTVWLTVDAQIELGPKAAP